MANNAQSRSIRDLSDQIRSGLPDYRDEMARAARNEAFYDGKNALYLERRENESPRDYEQRPKQFSRMTRRAVRVLSSLLYNPGPERQHPDPAADSFLQDVYERATVNAVMQRADRKAVLNGWCGIQAIGTGNPIDPIRLYLWGPDEAVVILEEDDPLTVWAVITKSMVPGRKPTTKRRRLEVYTADEFQRWESKDFDPHQVSFAESWNSGAEPVTPPQPNPYGVLPFAFVYADLPVNRFGGDGIGDPLTETNAEVDRMLSNMAELLESYNRPQGFARNVSANFRYSDKVGRFTRLDYASSEAVEAGLLPEAFYLQPSVEVESTWTHITELINQTFEDLDIPIRSVRGSASADAESGIAIVAKHSALTSYTKSKQPQFTLYEQKLADMILAVGSAFYGTVPPPGEPVAVVWPEPRMPISSAEIDQSDAYEQTWGITSKVALVMRRKGLTRTQAIEYLRELAGDMATEDEILGPVEDARAMKQQQMMGGQADGLPVPEAEADTEDSAEEDDTEEEA
jgi:hypothetical protein